MPLIDLRRLIAVLLLLAPVALATAAAPVEIIRVWPKHRPADSFVRISEFFGGKERAPELIIRTRPESREGYYFLTRFKSPNPLPGAILVIEYYLPGEETPRVQFFALDLPQGSRAVLAGLTGDDWPSAQTTPTAWRLRLLGSDGTELARKQSFLWAMPSTANTPPAPPPAS